MKREKMSADYYYFASSLPMLAADGEPPLSPAEFLELAAEQLTRPDFKALSAARLVPESGAVSSSRALAEWNAFEIGLRNEIVNYRARRSRREAEKYYRGEYRHDPHLAGVVAEIGAELNPLEIEQRLNGARWARLEEIGLNHFFDITYLTAYYLKLQLLEKINRMKAPAGEKILLEMLPAEEDAEI